MRKYARKRAKSVPPARLSRLTTQIAPKGHDKADLAPRLRRGLHGHFAHLPKNGGMRCKSLKVRALPANLRLSSEQIASCHFGLSL